MEAALAAFVLAPGLALGSFLNVVAARLPRRESIVRPRSRCGSCSSEIAWYDNVPLLSYALLRGRCRHCRARIGLVYPAVELTTALLLAGCVLRFGATPRAALAGAFCAALVVVTATDLTHRIVPNRVVVPASLVLLAGMSAVAPSPEWALAALGASAFLLAAALAYPGGMGMGDVKLAFLMGAALGRGVTVAFAVALAAALVPAVVLLARHGRAARKLAIPFAPFLALGSGERLLDVYLALF